MLQTGDGGLRGFASLSLASSRTRCALRRPPTTSHWRALPGSCLALSPDGATGAVGNVDGCTVWLVDTKSGSRAIELDGGLLKNSSCMLYQTCGLCLILLCISHCQTSHHPNHTTPGHTAPITHLALLPPAGGPSSGDPARLLSSGLDGCVKLWDPRSGSAAAATFAPSGPAAPPLSCVAAGGGGGALVAAGCRDGRVFVWDARRGDAELALCRAHEDEVTRLAFAPAADHSSSSDPLLFSASRDWTVRGWDAGGGGCRGVYVGHAGAVTSLAVCSDAKGGWGAAAPERQPQIATGCEDGSMGVWLAGGELQAMQRVHQAPVLLVVAAAGGGALVTGGLPGDLVVNAAVALAIS